MTLSNLGVNYFNQFQYEKAERYYREALTVDRAVFPPGHPNVAEKLANLGMTLQKRGKLAAADSMLSEALRIRRKRLGDQHFYTALGMVQLGALARAERLLREAVAANEATLGPEHLNTMVARNQLALVLRDQSRLEEAAPLLRRVSRAFRAGLGETHYYTGASLAQWADVQRRLGHAATAETSLREGVQILRQVLPEDHPSLVLSERNLGALLVQRGQYAEAGSLLTRAYAQMQDRYGPAHAETRDLAALHAAQQQPAQADSFRALAEAKQ